MNEKQFIDAFTSAGGWFFLSNYEVVKNWKGANADLIDLLYHEGFDKYRSGTSTRVSSMNRIIAYGYDQRALEKIRDSSIINAAHPDAYTLAAGLLYQYFGIK